MTADGPLSIDAEGDLLSDGLPTGVTYSHLSAARVRDQLDRARRCAEAEASLADALADPAPDPDPPCWCGNPQAGWGVCAFHGDR